MLGSVAVSQCYRALFDLQSCSLCVYDACDTIWGSLRLS